MRNDPSLPNSPFGVPIVVTLVQTEVCRPSRTTRCLDDDRIEHLGRHPFVVHVRTRDQRGDWNTAPISQHVAFDAKLCAIGRIGPSEVPLLELSPSRYRAMPIVVANLDAGRNSAPSLRRVSQTHRPHTTLRSDGGTSIQNQSRSASPSTDSLFATGTRYQLGSAGSPAVVSLRAHQPSCVATVVRTAPTKRLASPRTSRPCRATPIICVAKQVFVHVRVCVCVCEVLGPALS